MMLSDIEIAQKAELKPITEIGASIGIPAEDLENYGPYKAKVSLKLTRELENKPMGHLILVTAISPNPGRRRKDDHHRRPGTGAFPARQEGHDLPPRTVTWPLHGY